METIVYSQDQAGLDLALMLGQITREEYWEEVRRIIRGFEIEYLSVEEAAREFGLSEEETKQALEGFRDSLEFVHLT